MRYSAQDRRDIASGQFFTEAELAARPGLGRSIVKSAAAISTSRVDPNTRPPSAEARREAESKGLCAYCTEPGDDRSDVALQADSYFRHPECQAALEAERELEAE